MNNFEKRIEDLEEKILPEKPINFFILSDGRRVPLPEEESCLSYIVKYGRVWLDGTNIVDYDCEIFNNPEEKIDELSLSYYEGERQAAQGVWDIQGDIEATNRAREQGQYHFN